MYLRKRVRLKRFRVYLQKKDRFTQLRVCLRKRVGVKKLGVYLRKRVRVKGLRHLRKRVDEGYSLEMVRGYGCGSRGSGCRLHLRKRVGEGCVEPP